MATFKLFCDVKLLLINDIVGWHFVNWSSKKKTTTLTSFGKAVIKRRKKSLLYTALFLQYCNSPLHRKLTYRQIELP
jgi:hypothetical protein